MNLPVVPIALLPDQWEHMSHHAKGPAASALRRCAADVREALVAGESDLEPLTWADLIQTCSRTQALGQRMLDVVIYPVAGSAAAVHATVVPTRMHEPGFYVRSPNSTPLWAHWMLRSTEDLAMFQRFVELGVVHRAKEQTS